MGLEKYKEFILNPSTKTFNEFINGSSEFKKVYKLNKKKLETIFKLLKLKHLDFIKN
jgi:MinD-like ATPase involved in chromosome partitioning or flagellar assembly